MVQAVYDLLFEVCAILMYSLPQLSQGYTASLSVCLTPAGWRVPAHRARAPGHHPRHHDGLHLHHHRCGARALRLRVRPLHRTQGWRGRWCVVPNKVNKVTCSLTKGNNIASKKNNPKHFEEPLRTTPVLFLSQTENPAIKGRT